MSEFISNVANIFSVANILLMVITVFISGYVVVDKKISDERLRRDQIAAIHLRFTDETMRSARSDVWYKVIPAWYSSRDTRQKYVYFSERENLASLISDWISKKRSNKNFSKEDQDLAYDIAHMISFYAYIYRLLSKDRHALRSACNEYHYYWWRGFLLSYVLMSYCEWKKICCSPELKSQLSFHNNLELILKLDIESMDVPFIHENNVFYGNYIVRDDDVYPGLDEHNRKLICYRHSTLPFWKFRMFP